jgi:hypothetical protein
VKIGGNWGGIANANRVPFNVGGGGTRPEVTVDERSGEFRKGGAYWWDDWSRGYDGHLYYTCVNGNAVDSWGEWRPNLAGGNYEVFALIPSYHSNTNNARYEIHHRNGVTTAARAQAPYSDQWISLGTYSFDAGAAGYVRLTDATGEPASCGVQIAFDAIRWAPR